MYNNVEGHSKRSLPPHLPAPVSYRPQSDSTLKGTILLLQVINEACSSSKTLFVYSCLWFCCLVVLTSVHPLFRLSTLPSYYIPRDGPQSSYQEYISMLPPAEHPEVFGQNFNADIASQIAEARMLFDTLLSLRPQVSGPTAGAGPSREDKVRGRETEVDVLSLISLRPSETFDQFCVVQTPADSSPIFRCWSCWQTFVE